MHALSFYHYHRRPLHRLALGGYCILLVTSPSAFGQLLEFKSSEFRGRIDRPTSENVWILGDNNGNGTLDENESFGPRIGLDQVFPKGTDRSYLEIAPADVVFGEPTDLMFGYIDAWDGLVEGGPFTPDGAADDLNGDSSAGYINPVGNPVGLPFQHSRGDFDDLVRLPSAIDLIGTNNFAHLGGAHLMHVFTFESDPEFSLSTTNETVEVGLGARFLSGFSDLRVHATGGVIGELNLDSSLETQALGPQVSMRWTLRKGPWQARVGGAAAITYVSIDGDQSVEMGEDLIPGQFNRPIYMPSVRAANHLNEWDLAPVLEAGVRGSYDVTPTTQCFIRGDVLQFSEVREAHDTVVFQLPSMGLRDPGGFDVTITAASIGIEVRR